MSLEVSRQHTMMEFSEANLQLIKDTICKGSTDQEFQLFVHACKRTGLDPLARQIYAVKRWDSSLKREAMALQVGIDGYRLIAERSGRYAPGKESTYTYDKMGNLLSATAYIKKQTQDGTWHEVPATAFFKEYCGYTKDKQPTHMWASKPHIMLSKCAEANALRKAFPAELSGIYTKEEMDQADSHKMVEVMDESSGEIVESNYTPPPAKIPKISQDQLFEITDLLHECEQEFVADILEKLKKPPFNANSLAEMPQNIFERIKKSAIENSKKEKKEAI